MLAIGAFAMDHPYTGGELHSLERFKYGRFVTSIKTSSAMGTASSFYLYAIPDQAEEVWYKWNSINILPSHEPHIMTRMNEEE